MSDAASAAYAGGDVVAEVIRSGFVEGYHRGSVAVLDASGALVASVGDVTTAIFPRSSNKPMQAVGMLRAGLNLDDPADLALCAASHSGEPIHISRVRAMLAAGGLSESDLRTPPDLPLSETARDEVLRSGGAAAPVYMNCSGKHTGMLRTCVAAGWSTDDYPSPDHPLQKQLRTAVEDIAGESVTAVGVDGCGAPVMAISLSALAGAFLRCVSAPDGSDERRVADAMRAHPTLVSGSGADDERLMQGIPGLLSKGGAEGVLAIAMPGVGAVAAKIDDGAARARVPVVLSALRWLGIDVSAVDDIAETPVLGGGRWVGSVRSVVRW
ncbi:MAG TPA: asparaginase [Micromonosporaceae bacterium]|nr:asparaginase [Micromonosporaceae bacterium]